MKEGFQLIQLYLFTAVASLGKFPDARVIFDFGKAGRSSSDVQFVMDYDERSGTFSVRSMKVG